MAEAHSQSKPTVAELDEHLRSLVDWEKFGIQLQAIQSFDVNLIKRNHANDAAGQKLALYDKWLTVCPNATWSDVVTALEKANECTLAEQVKSLHNNEQCDGREEEKVIQLEDAVISELKQLHSSYTVLFTRTREHIEELVETNQLTLHKVTSRLEDAFHSLSVRGLAKCKFVTEIFDILREHSHFLDGSILILAIESVIGKLDLLQEAIEHEKRAQQFKTTQPIKILKNKLKESKVGQNHIPTTIKLNKPWGEAYIKFVEKLIKTLLQLKGDIQWISVDPGSVRIIISIPKEEEKRITNTCSQKKDFMKQMGIFNLQIGTNTILDTQENNHYSFELGLLEACAVGNIETVQFLLQMQFLSHISLDVDHTNEQGQTPLMIASENGHVNIVKLLLSEKANVNKQDNTGQTAVMLAKTIEIYQTLVQANADTTIVTHIGLTPLYISCLLGNHEVAEHLLKHDTTTHPDGFTLLMAASLGGNHRIVQYLLEKEHDPNLQTHDGWTPLMIASQEGHIKIVELLLQNGVDPNVTNAKDGTTALIIASDNGHHDTVELLLTKGADPNIQNNDGRTAIDQACLMGHYRVTELLLKHKADPNLPAHEGCTPLMAASQEGHIKIVELLLQNEVDPNVTNAKDGTTALIIASDNGHHDTVELLLTKGADPNIQNNDGRTAIDQACLMGHYRVTELLLKHKADPNLPAHEGCTPLMAASLEGHIKIVELLLQNGVDPNVTNTKNGITALILASLKGHHDTVELLLMKGAHPNIQNNGRTAIELKHKADPNLPAHEGCTPLMAASLEGHIKIVELLLQNGVDPNATNTKNGVTALILASLKGHHDTVELLLMKGADPNIQNNGRTAIELACLMGHYTVTELLLKHKADPNLPTHDGWTPLMTASQEGHIKIVELLLQNEVDPNVRNTKKETTALILAIPNGHHDTVELLLMKGADPNIQNNDGTTAIDQACLMGHYTVTELLLKHKADPNLPTHDGWTPLMIASQKR